MPIDAAKCQESWLRYQWCRDNGHTDFVVKADKCDAFFRGDQWTAEDRAKLRLQRRPALTINKILSTIGNVMGEQIYNRSEISYRPRSGAAPENAETLAKVFKQISDNNQLDWKRSDMFADGVITSRGFLDVRINFDDSLVGEVRIDKVNPKNVIIDPDGDDMDPDTWKEVFITKWVTADDIAILYNKADADLLRNRESMFAYGFDSIQTMRDRFGHRNHPAYANGYDISNVQRDIRMIERQYRKLDKQKHFVSLEGDTRPIPEDFDRNRIAFFVEKYGFKVTTKLVARIRWTVTADNVLLHDDWSPYKHLTVVPYFPYFRHGRTLGLVENLLDPQELLNKVSSQELHVVNTTANSGWKVKSGALTNMSPQELEQRGAETGLVLEVNGDPDKDVVKITPNSVPSGLDRVSYKAEEHIKTISGVSDSAQGFDREDVAAKAIQAKRQAGQTNLAKPLDSLVRTDFMLARNILDLVQQFYTEERVMTITHAGADQRREQFAVNQATAEGTIVNDLTLGEYDVVISSVPQRETLEDSQFEQAMAMREAGISIPEDVIIESSRLLNKRQIVEKMNAAAQSPEAQKQQQIALEGAQAEVDKTKAETMAKHADAGLKQAKAQKEGIAGQKDAMTPIEQEQGDGGAALMKAQADIQLQREKFAFEKEMKVEEMQFDQQKETQELNLKAQDMSMRREDDRAARAAEAAKPQPSTQGESR